MNTEQLSIKELREKFYKEEIESMTEGEIFDWFLPHLKTAPQKEKVSEGKAGITMTCNHWFVPQDHQWKVCKNCGLIEPN